MIIQTKRFRESICKHWKTAMPIEKNPAAFLACYFWGIVGKVLIFSLPQKEFQHLFPDFGINRCLDS